jgi:hypothetical protein
MSPLAHPPIRQMAIDETKKRGDPVCAIALALVYLADVIAI